MRQAALRELEKKRRRVSELERLIEAAEAELALLREKLRDPPSNDWEQLHEWAKKERTLAQGVEQMMSEWTKLSAELEKLGSTAEEAQG